jgi:hypothetical protein
MVEIPAQGPPIWRMVVIGHLANPNERFIKAARYSPASPDLGTDEVSGADEWIVLAAQGHFAGEEIIVAPVESPSGITVNIPGEPAREVALEEILVIPPPFPVSAWGPDSGFGYTLQILGPGGPGIPGRIGWDLPRLNVGA